jgi:trans-aconitate methyltransferase
MIARARSIAPKASFAAGDLTAFLNATTEPAALIVCSSVLEYLDDPLSVVRLAASKLGPEGTLLLSVPNRRSLFRALERVVPRSYVQHWGNTLAARDYVQAASAAGLRFLRLRHFGAPLFQSSPLFGPLTLIELAK